MEPSPLVLFADPDPSVAAYEDPDRALEAAPELAPDVAVLDVRMPGMSGLDLAEELRSGGGEFPVVLLSALGTDADILRGYRRGASYYLTKPCDPRPVLNAADCLAGDLEPRTAGESRGRALRRRAMPTTADRVRLRARRIQGQKLQAIGQVAAGIAHEIDNPIGYILSNLGMLGEYARDRGRLLDASLEAVGRLPADDDHRARVLRLAEELNAGFLIEDFRNAAEESRQGAERIRDIVRRLKAFAHVDDGEARPVDLEDVLEEALRIASNELKYKATVRREIADVPPIRGHALGLEQVFVNLLVNAAQAIEGRGEVVVALAREGGEAVVRVRARAGASRRRRGIGSSSPSSPRSRRGRGPAWPLHVARTIVEGHRGRIEAFSEPGRGAECVLRFPLEEGRR